MTEKFAITLTRISVWSMTVALAISLPLRLQAAIDPHERPSVAVAPHAPALLAQAPADQPAAAPQPDAVVPPVKREKPAAQPGESNSKTNSAPEAPYQSSEGGGVLGTIQDWLARANREYQGTVMRRLAIPPAGTSADDAIARKLEETKSEDARAAALKKAEDEKQAAEAQRVEDERRKAAEAKRQAEAAAKSAPKVVTPAPEAPKSNADLENEIRRERERLEAEAVRIEEQKKAADAKRAEDQKKADARAAEARASADAKLAEDRRRDEQAKLAVENEKHRSRAIVLTPEPITRPEPTARTRRAQPDAEPAPAPRSSPAAEASSDDGASSAEPSRRVAFNRISARPSYLGATARRSAVKGWVWRARDSRCHAAGHRIRLPGRYTVGRGDSLWRIAERHYRFGRLYRKIYRANRSLIRDPDLIYPCQRFWVPRRRG